MINLKDYINESIFDSENVITENADKVIIDGIKSWVKTNIQKSHGRIKINSKTGEITPPDYAGLRITCPFPVGVSFGEFKPGQINMRDVTEEELSIFFKNIDSNSIMLEVNSNKLNSIPEELNGASGVMSFTVGCDINFNNYKLNLTSLSLNGRGHRISGTKSIRISDDNRHIGKIQLEWLTMKDDLDLKGATVGEIWLNDVKAKKTILSGLKYAKDIQIENSSNIDLSSCECEIMRLHDVNEKYDYSFLPKKIDRLFIQSSEDFNSFDLSRIKSKVNRLVINGAEVNMSVGPMEQKMLYLVKFMQSPDGRKIDVIPDELLEYIAKHTKEIDDPDKIKDGKDYITVCGGQWNKDADKLTRMSYYEDYGKNDDGADSTLSRASDGRWSINKSNSSVIRYDANPKSFVKGGEYGDIRHFRIFEVPSSFTPFVKKIMNL